MALYVRQCRHSESVAVCHGAVRVDVVLENDTKQKVLLLVITNWIRNN